MSQTAAHSKIGASSMHRWANCPGSVRLSHGIVSPPSPYAEEGTRAHELAAHYLEHKRWPGGVVDAEMRESVLPYIEYVRGISDPLAAYEGAFLLVEHRFDLSSIYPGLFGTADAVIYSPKDKKLTVADLKFGRGIAVEAEHNEQLQYYALGAMLTTGAVCETVDLVVVQPRCDHPQGPVRTWTISADDLLDFGAVLVQAARRTEDPDAPLVPGEHCRFCPAAGICPTVHSKALTLAKEEFRNDLSYNPEKLAKTLEWLPTLEAWIKSVKDFAYGEAFHGRPAPGFKLVEKRATRKWQNEILAAEVLSDVYQLEADDLFEKKIKTPAAIEKLLGKKNVELGPLVVAASSGLVLVPESDKRPAAKLDAKSEFLRIETDQTE